MIADVLVVIHKGGAGVSPARGGSVSVVLFFMYLYVCMVSLI